MRRRTMLPYPSTSRRVCSTSRFPKAPTVILLTILFACLYTSREFISRNGQSTVSHDERLDRAGEIDKRLIALEPAVEVVKEITHDRDLSTATADNPVANRPPAQAPPSHNVVHAPVEVVPVSQEGDLVTSANGGSSLGSQTAEKDLVGYVSKASKGEGIDPAVPAAGDLVSSGNAPVTVDRTGETAESEITSLSMVEKKEEDLVEDTTQAGVEGSAEVAALDSAERTEEGESASSTEKIIGELPVVNKEEEEDAMAVRTEETDAAAKAALPVEDIPSAEKQDDKESTSIEEVSAVLTTNSGEGEVAAVDKQETEVADILSSASGEAPVEGEGIVPDLNTAEKETKETDGELAALAQDQETEREVMVDDTTEKIESNEASEVEIRSAEMSEVVEEVGKDLELSEKPVTKESEEESGGEKIADSEKQDLVDNEEVAGSEIKESEKQADANEEEATAKIVDEAERADVIADDEVSPKESELSDKQGDLESPGEVLDIDVADKLEEKEGRDNGNMEVESGNDDLTAVDKKEISEAEGELETTDREALVSKEQGEAKR